MTKRFPGCFLGGSITAAMSAEDGTVLGGIIVQIPTKEDLHPHSSDAIELLRRQAAGLRAVAMGIEETIAEREAALGLNSKGGDA